MGLAVALEGAGLGWTSALVDHLQACVIDTLSGDDVEWLQQLMNEHKPGHPLSSKVPFASRGRSAARL